MAAVYPARARIDKIQGSVVIDALIDTTGKVADMKVISGAGPLQPAAMLALKTWKYEPVRLDGEPIDLHIKVSIAFQLN